MMDVGIAGAGAIAMGYAALLIQNGHSPNLWSPTGQRTLALFDNEPIRVTGAIEGQFFPAPCKSAELLAKNDVIVLALPAYGHRVVLDGLIPFLEERHTVVFSGHLSFAALYLSKQLAQRRLQIPVIAWNTTALTAKAPDSFSDIKVGALRPRIDIAVLPSSASRSALELCNHLFGPEFSLVDDLITIALTNLNPQNHLAMVIGNLTRIETGEDWKQNKYVTPAVGRLMEALDHERVTIAKAFGKSVPTLRDKLTDTLGSSFEEISDAYQLQIQRGSNPPGPKDLDTRYVLEDLPFGLHPTVWLAHVAGLAAPLHQAGISILNSCYSRELHKENDLLGAFGGLSQAELGELVKTGYPLEPLRLSDCADVHL